MTYWDDYLESIVIIRQGDVYTTGIFYSGSLNFGGLGVTNASANNPYVFIAKIGTATAIEESENPKQLSLYPNPFSDKFILNSKQPFQNATLSITNILGQEVRTLISINGNSAILEIGNLKSGMYFISIYEGNQIIYSEKVMVKD